MESTIKYSFAYDEKDCIVNIDEIVEKDRENHKYHCVSCGNEMIAKLGSKNAHHFAHKMDCSCDGETYLHKLAKKLIKKKFDESEKFSIFLKQRVICKKKGECKFFSDDKCWDIDYKEFDLKNFYTNCQEEGPIKDENGNKYIADLLLSHTKKIDRDPLLIEFVVSHKCSEEKIKSGLRIIEIPIKDERDIIERYNSDKWEYNNCTNYYNFREIKSEAMLGKKKFSRVVLKRNGQIEQKNCILCNQKKDEHSEIEINVLNHFLNRSKCVILNHNIVVSCLLKLGYTINSCLLCENYRKDKRTCNIAKTKGTPCNPESSVANYCKYYCCDASRINDLKQEIPNDVIQVVE